MKLSDITVEQFIKLSQIESIFKDDESKIVMEICNLFYPKGSLKVKDAKIFYLELKEALLQEPKFVQRFTHEGVEYGFIPNLEEITTGEYIDLDTYQRNSDHYHKMLSILYRPIVKSYGNLYEIEDYEGTKYENVMKNVSCEVLLGSIHFFFRLFELILKDLHIYSQQIQKKQKKKID